MQNTQSHFVVNIVPLANVISNVSGLDSLSGVASAVGNIQQMINFDEKTVYTNYLKSYTTDGSINVLSPLNLSNVGITSNSIPISGTTGAAAVSSVGSATSFLNFYDTVNPLDVSVNLNVSGKQVLQFSGNGDGLVYDSTRTTNEFRVSSMTFAADLGVFSTVSVGGTCFAQQFLTLSDERAKRNITLSDMSSITEKLEKIHPYSYTYSNSDKGEIGLLAQELEGVFPECIEEAANIKYVKYNSVVALLIGAVKSLSKRVADLELRIG